MQTIFSFDEFRKANQQRDVSGVDYVRAIYTLNALPADFLMRFAKMLWPDFRIVDGLVFVSELFDDARYVSHINSGMSSRQAQFWINLLEVTGIFDGLSTGDAESLAHIIADSWSAKIRGDFGSKEEAAKVIVDKDTDEVFVVLGELN